MGLHAFGLTTGVFRRWALGVVGVLLLFPTSDCLAGDGRLEISQPVMPYAIVQPGSYIVTGELTGAAGRVGISINANDVTVDLNGFTLRGVPGSLEGIRVFGTRRNIGIRNGVVRDWGLHGVDAIQAENSSVENLKALNNGLEGTSQDGLRIGAGGRVAGCEARANQNHGIRAEGGCSIANSTVAQNGGTGIVTATGCTITHCSADANSDDGISTSGSTVHGNTSHGNGGDGIEVAQGSMVSGNACDSNAGAGIRVAAAGNRIDGNNVTNNSVGIDVDAAGNFVVRNTSSGSTSADYTITAGNDVGQISSTPIGADPWANFSY